MKMTVEKPKANVNIDEEEKEEVRLYVGLLGFKSVFLNVMEDIL